MDNLKGKTVGELFSGFYKWAEIPEDFELGEFVYLKKDAPESAKEAFGEYLRRLFRHALSDDRYLTEGKRITGFVNGLEAKEKSSVKSA